MKDWWGEFWKEKRVLIAPMSGISNYVFRKLMVKAGADLVFTEMLSDRGLLNKTARSMEISYIAPDEKRVGVQLFGREPDIMAEAGNLMQKRGAFVIDINIGCPARKVIKKKKGAYLLKEPGVVRDIVLAMKKKVSVPVTAKIRKGWHGDGKDGMKLVEVLLRSGIDAITVHARTVEGGYSEPVDLDFIKVVKESSDVPIVGNGGIRKVEDALKMVEKTGCDGVMLATGVLGNPWLVRDIKSAFRGVRPEGISKEEFFAVLKGFLLDYIEFKGKERAFRETKKFISWFIKDLPAASKIRDRINRADDWNEVWKVVDGYEAFVNYRFDRGRKAEWKKTNL